MVQEWVILSASFFLAAFIVELRWGKVNFFREEKKDL